MPVFSATSAPLVSVVVRSMDRVSLQRALQSVVGQDHRPIELVLVNALGQAHSPLPTQVADLQVQMVAGEGGQALRRPLAAQAGLQAANGEWILFLDDDDSLLPDHLSRLVQAGQAHAEAPAVYADVELGREVEGVWQVQHLFAADFDAVRLLFENYLPIHAVLFRRDRVQQGVQFDTSLDLFEDWDFWLQLAELGRFVRVPGVSARYVAADAGHSAVFEDTPAARAARERLFEKWRRRMDPSRYVQLLSRLQGLFRQTARLQGELSALQRGHAEQGAVLRAREAELADCMQLLGVREAELSSAHIEREAQQLLLAARERELANALAGIEAQREVLTHRDLEIRNGAEYTTSLRETLDQREREIADAVRQITDVQREIADGQRHNAELHVALDVTQQSLNQREAELAALHAERPLQALARTLRSKNKPHASRT